MRSLSPELLLNEGLILHIRKCWFYVESILAATQPFFEITTTMQLKSFDLLEDTTALIQACIEGDRYSQSRLYKIFAPKMFSTCLRYAKTREEAEEILQEGFVQVFKSLKNFKNTGAFEGWIKKIMVHCAVQQFRSKSKLVPVINLDTVALEEMGTEDIITQLGKKELLKMIQALPPAYRMIFNLYVFEGMKHREIAALLGIAEGTSKSNFSDAKVILQRAVTNSLRAAKQKY
ncbi:MAG: hypothetical protein JWQ09_931 [Segetibacter sp.]|nr:hypothetical protein [Segetibacter sp.]